MTMEQYKLLAPYHAEACRIWLELGRTDILSILYEPKTKKIGFLANETGKRVEIDNFQPSSNGETVREFSERYVLPRLTILADETVPVIRAA